ncbi:MAG: LysM peptidoglycan-binding domain-containing protein [Sphingobacteriaceae bacterium]|nr:MAG: LysM peptidoglycan-binding domain-containing protein [Sphingobacteriaceae bacterium]
MLFISSLAFAAPVLAASPLDSIGVENQNGKKVILHKLDPKDNYFSIGRRYNIKPNSIIQYNNNAALKIGGIVKVPTEIPFDQQANVAQTTAQQPKPAVVTAPPVQQTKPAVPQVAKPTPAVTQQQPVETVAENNDPGVQDYKVASGESLFSIAKRFNTTVENLISLNKLTTDVLSSGQVIKVKANTPNTPVPVSDTRITAARDSTVPVTTDSASAGVRPNRYGLYEKSEKGVATWMDDSGLDANKKLVLHRTAPIGTVIKIVNPMTNRTTFAKVVGRFTENESTRDVVIVMTKNVAESLGALDKRFHVNLSYGTTNE